MNFYEFMFFAVVERRLFLGMGCLSHIWFGLGGFGQKAWVKRFESGGFFQEDCARLFVPDSLS